MSAPGAPYEVRLDAEHARELAQRGGTLLLLDVPAGTALGVDQQTFLVGPKFKGVKMLPPGTHFLSCTPASATGGGDFGPTTGGFVWLRPGEVLVRRWDAAQEALGMLTDEDEVERYAAAVRAFQLDAVLAPYDLSSYNAWRRLAGHITPEVLEAVAPVGGALCVLAEADPAAGRPATAAERALDDQLAAGAARRAAAAAEAAAAGPAADTEETAPAASTTGGRAFYTALPRLVRTAGLSPAQLTALNLDKSSTLEALLGSAYGGDEGRLLGEFEYAFLAFLLAHSLEGFAQWAAFLRLLFGCEDAPLGGRSALFVRFLRVLRAQLEAGLGGPRGARGGGAGAEGASAAIGSALLMDELLADSFLRRVAGQWFEMLSEESPRASPELLDAARSAASALSRLLGWGGLELRELGGVGDQDEDLPVVVDVDSGELG